MLSRSIETIMIEPRIIAGLSQDTLGRILSASNGLTLVNRGIKL